MLAYLVGWLDGMLFGWFLDLGYLVSWLVCHLVFGQLID